MEDDSFRQESPVNTSKENQSFFFPEFDLNKFSSFSEVPGYQEDFDTLRMDLNDATINRSNTGQRRPKTGRYWKLYPMDPRKNHAYGSVHRGTDPQNRFQSRGNHGQPHQSHMMRFSGRQQNRHNLYSPRNETNQRQG
ncbi:hypothetical protein TNCV_1813821 [Trichonephila clavipes]|uniref:Uncharacterized protein n=1 Tax=Trichonephila clavipes TaxID=2585209 RepID=A0A8X7BGS7_TRICX|nr:hypothetical protein TNCV_1813821 [Trichonephila clavipes]